MAAYSAAWSARHSQRPVGQRAGDRSAPSTPLMSSPVLLTSPSVAMPGMWPESVGGPAPAALSSGSSSGAFRPQRTESSPHAVADSCGEKDVGRHRGASTSTTASASASSCGGGGGGGGASCAHDAPGAPAVTSGIREPRRRPVPPRIDTSSLGGAVSSIAASGGAGVVSASPELRSPSSAAAAAARTRAIGGAAPGLTSPTSGTPPQLPVWKRALYEKQPFEDNYVDAAEFLQGMRKNANVTHYEYADIVRDTLAVLQQLSIVVVFACVFAATVSRRIALSSLLMINVAALAASLGGYGVLCMLEQNENGSRSQHGNGRRATAPANSSSGGRDGGGTAAALLPSMALRRDGGSPRRGAPVHPPPPSAAAAGSGGVMRLAGGGRSHASDSGAADLMGRIHRHQPLFNQPPPTLRLRPPPSALQRLRQVFVFVSALLLLAPVFRTLTVNYTDDTIWALSIATLFAHFIFADYNYLNGYSQEPNQQTAVIAALFATMLMASRISSTLHASLLIGFGSLCFAFSPFVRHQLRLLSFTAHVAVTSLLSGVAFGCLLAVPLLALLFCAAMCGVAFVVPAAFVALQQRFKFQINGPWDEAKPRRSAEAQQWANAGLLS